MGYGRKYSWGSKRFRQAIKVCRSRKSPFNIIQGSIEAERGTVQVKDLKLGSKFSETIDSMSGGRSILHNLK